MSQKFASINPDWLQPPTDEMNLLVRVGLREIEEANEKLTSPQRQLIVNTLTQLVMCKLSYRECASILSQFTNGVGAVTRLVNIMKTNQECPAPSRACADLRPRIPGKRKKAIVWSTDEDNRLIMAVNIYGTENWPAVSRFVGQGRTRGQCSQRWVRVLDPKISKRPWTAKEDLELCKAVEKFGERNWMRVAESLGNRSDVQCRYRYRQRSKAQPKPGQSGGLRVITVKDNLDFLDADPTVVDAEQYPHW